ncbi:hypothetical protein V1520DRAFT_280695 [Lipomyces starkeyi]
MSAVKQLAVSNTEKDAEEQLQQIEKDFPPQAIAYFKTQWWTDRERWAELHVRKHVNFGISITSRVEGSHAALKAVLASSSGTLFTAGKKINRQGLLQTRRNSIIGSNENVIVKTAVRDRVGTAGLGTKISRSALELLHAEVMKKVHNQEEAESSEHCNCDTYHRYLLPCSHHIRLNLPIDVRDIHPRWLVEQPTVPPDIATLYLDLDTVTLATLRDPPVTLPRKGRPRGTRRLPTSAEIVQRAADRVENVRRCGLCKGPGHNKRTCPKVLMSNQSSMANDTGEGVPPAQGASEDQFGSIGWSSNFLSLNNAGRNVLGVR